jgi:dTDP-4-amino-4,6-dideoxygalactose transaminase
VHYCGATPVFVDVERDTYNIDPTKIEAALSAKTRAILVVHQMGMPCNLEPIVALARRKGIPVIEDAACAVGAEIQWQGKWEKIGKVHGDVACFSFHPRKILSTGDGGMITTRHPDWDARFRLLRQHGMSVPDTVRHGSAQVIFESYPIVGFNFRMTDIQAAVGREQLKRLPDTVKRRRELAASYTHLLASIPGIETPREPAFARSNWQSYCVRLPDRCDQRKVMQYALDRGIATRRGIMCSHREAPYANLKLVAPLVQSEAAQDHSIVLPLYSQMTAEDQDRVVTALREACAG